MADDDFTWIDAERLIRFGPDVAGSAPALLAERGFEGFALLTSERTAGSVVALSEAADAVLHVPGGPVPEAAAAVRADVGGRPLVALGGGRVIDAAKAIAGADGLPCAAVPTTLSGAPMTRLHRMPAGVSEWRVVRPSVVVGEPELMASQETTDRAASAMNALAHAAEALYGPHANPVADLAGLRGAEQLARGLEAGSEEKARPALALGAILAGYAVGSAGLGLHHIIGQTVVRVTGVPHARAYAALLPYTLEAMLVRAPREIARLGVALGLGTGNAASVPARVSELAALAGGAGLRELGVGEESLDEVVAETLRRPDLARVPGGPPSEEELREILRAAL